MEKMTCHTLTVVDMWEIDNCVATRSTFEGEDLKVSWNYYQPVLS